MSVVHFDDTANIYLHSCNQSQIKKINEIKLCITNKVGKILIHCFALKDILIQAYCIKMSAVHHKIKR